MNPAFRIRLSQSSNLRGSFPVRPRAWRIVRMGAKQKGGKGRRTGLRFALARHGEIQVLRWWAVGQEIGSSVGGRKGKS